MQNFIISFILCMSALACSDMKTRPETADKLKPILVLVNPPEESEKPLAPLPRSNFAPPLPGKTVKLEFHFIGPADFTSITLTPGEPEPRPLTLPISNWTVEAAKPHPYPGLQHITIVATAPIPSAEQLTALAPTVATLGVVRLRYTLIVSDGNREVPLAGDFLVYRDNEVESAKTNLFGSSIDAPLANQDLSDKKLSIASTLQNEQDEPVKIGWYVSAGEIKNRRASATEWELPGSGSYTLIFTIRGKESRNGDIQIREVVLP